MAQQFDVGNKDRLLDDERRLALDPDRVIAALPLRPYQHVADIGCGPGYFTLPLAKYLYDGKLYAMDSKQEMLDACRERLSRYRFTNVEYALSSGGSIPLEPGSVDGVLMAFVLHETDDRQAFLSRAAGILKAGGWLALLEWKKKKTEQGPKVSARIDLEEAQAMLQEAGLRSYRAQDTNDDQYMIIARK
jgi:ubiquinone/menaquinone biosynthesis C-methylase UbiE